MATTIQNTSGGTTASFSNTPQAVDDTFNYSASISGILILNVMASDLGGNAKSLPLVLRHADTSSLTTQVPVDAPAGQSQIRLVSVKAGALKPGGKFSRRI